MSFQADPKKPIGGNIIAHASTTRYVGQLSSRSVSVTEMFEIFTELRNISYIL